MKKLISMALTLLMTISCMGTSFAAVSPEDVSVDGWNGWSVNNGSGVTTLVNPLVGDSNDRGTIVKVSGGSAERYFARWFTGVIELSVDVYGEGTISFEDSNGRSAGTVTLENGKIAGVDCDYNSTAWNKLSLFIATGTKKTEVYLGDTCVTTLTLESLVRPTKLIVTADDGQTIYIDNITVEELFKTQPYADGALEVQYQDAFTDGKGNWSIKKEDYSIIEQDTTTFSGESVMKMHKETGDATSTTRLFLRKNIEGNLVFETELYQTPLDTNVQTSEFTIYIRNERYNSDVEGRSMHLLRFGKDGYIDLGCEHISSEAFIPEPLYKLGEWFKVKVEVLTENQSIIVYIANKDASGKYGEWVKINDKPVPIYSNEDSTSNAETHTAFSEINFSLNNSKSRTGLWYIDNTKISTLKSTETVTAFYEDFEGDTVSLKHNNTEDTTTNYLSLTPKKAPAEPDGTTGTMGQLHSSRLTSDNAYVGEGTPIESNATSTGEISKTKNSKAKQEYWSAPLDLTDAESVKLSFQYYGACIARDSNEYKTTRDSFQIRFGTATEMGTTDGLSGLSFQSTTFKFSTDGDSSSKLKRQEWENVTLTLTPYDETTEEKNITASITSDTIKEANNAVTADALKTISELKLYLTIKQGGRCYLDNLKVTKEVAIGGIGYLKKIYAPYSRVEDAVTRGELTDIAFRYVEFADSEGNVCEKPANNGYVKSITIEKNAAMAEGTKLLVAVYDNGTLSDTEIVTLTDAENYTLAAKPETTSSSTVGVFVWNMNTLTPVIKNEAVDMEQRTQLMLIGDSLVCEYADDEADTRSGWGELLGEFVNTNKLSIKNYADSGATTGDFLGNHEKRTKAYNKAIDALKQGDYLIISLTGNDADGDSGISSGGAVTDEWTGDTSSFVANLCKMIADVKSKNATPVLVTAHPKCYYISEAIPRFQITPERAAFVKDVQRVAQAKGVPVINLFEMATDCYDTGNVKIGSSKKNSDEATDGSIRDTYYVSSDHTHLTREGARKAASFIAKGMAQLNCGIEDFVK